jgi:hypothetical protein
MSGKLTVLTYTLAVTLKWLAIVLLRLIQSQRIVNNITFAAHGISLKMVDETREQ